MSTVILGVIAGVVLLGLAIWKGRKILISKNDNGDYELEISKLKKEVKLLKIDNYKLAEGKANVTYTSKNILDHINTKGMNMKKLRAIVKKNN